jgi:hypothetical protein
MHFRDLLGGRHVPGTYRPQRLVTDRDDGRGHAVGDAAGDLIAAYGQCLAGQPLRFRLADADDRQKSRAPRGPCLRRHDVVGLAMMLTAFRMSDDDGRGACISQHFGADVTGERTGDFRAAILPTDGDPAAGGLHRPRDQRRGQADQNVGEWRRGFHRGGNCFDFAELGRQPVHLPVTGDQRLHNGPSERITRRQT